MATEAGAATAAAATTGLLGAHDRLFLLLLLTVVLLGGFQRVVLHLVLLLAFASCLLVDLLHRPQLLLELHPAVLEPDLDLSLGETQRVGDLDSSSAGQVVVKVEFLLQFERLEAGVRLAAASSWAAVWTSKITAHHTIEGVAHPIGHEPGMTGDVGQAGLATADGGRQLRAGRSERIDADARGGCRDGGGLLVELGDAGTSGDAHRRVAVHDAVRVSTTAGFVVEAGEARHRRVAGVCRGVVRDERIHFTGRWRVRATFTTRC